MRIKLQMMLLGLLAIGGASAQQLAKAVDCKIVTTPGTRVVINGGITFTGTSNWKDSGEVFIARNTGAGRENWADSTAAGVYDATSNGKVHFTSDSLQFFYGNTQFYNLRVAGDSGLYLNTDAEVRNQLDLDKALLFTTATSKVYVSNPALNSIQSTNNFANSWVHGRLERAANNTAVSGYLFPVGKIKNGDSLYAPVKLAKFNANTARYITEYFPDRPLDRTTVMSPPIDHISDVEYWEITSNIVGSPDDDARVSLSWRGYSAVSSLAARRDSLLVAQYIQNPGFIWDVPGGWATGNVVGADSLFGYVTSNADIASFTFAERRFTLGSYSPFNALPVKLIYFTAVPDGKQVRLGWQVQQEQDVRLYEMEHSVDGIHFAGIGNITSLQKAEWTYSGYHANPIVGWNYYRLRITDRLGKQTYTGIARVQFGENAPSIKLFPNPTVDVVNIQMPSSYVGKVSLLLYNSSGALISTTRPTTTNLRLNVQPLAAGTYFIQLVDGKEVKVYPFVKQ
jgi:Secretion system C-terminal sorting domain